MAGLLNSWHGYRYSAEAGLLDSRNSAETQLSTHGFRTPQRQDDSILVTQQRQDYSILGTRQRQDFSAQSTGTQKRQDLSTHGTGTQQRQDFSTHDIRTQQRQEFSILGTGAGLLNVKN